MIDSGERDSALQHDRFTQHLARMRGETVHFYPGSGDIEVAIATLSAHDLFGRYGVDAVSHANHDLVAGTCLMVGVGQPSDRRRPGAVSSDFERLLQQNDVVVMPQNTLRFARLEQIGGPSAAIFCSSALAREMALLEGADPDRTLLAFELAAHVDVVTSGASPAESCGTLVIGGARFCDGQAADLDHVVLAGFYGSDRLARVEDCRAIVEGLLCSLRPYAAIRTDRPAVALLAAAVGMSVTLYDDGSRSRAEALQEATSALFPNLTIHRAEPSPGARSASQVIAAHGAETRASDPSDAGAEPVALLEREISSLKNLLAEARRASVLAAQAHEAELARLTTQRRALEARMVRATLVAEGRAMPVLGQEAQDARLVPYRAFKVLQASLLARCARLDQRSVTQAGALRGMDTDLQNARFNEAAARRVSRDLRAMMQARHADLERQTADTEAAAALARAEVDRLASEAGTLFEQETSRHKALLDGQAEFDARLAGRKNEVETRQAEGRRSRLSSMRRWRAEPHRQGEALGELVEAASGVEEARRLYEDARQARLGMENLASQAEPHASELASAAAVLRSQADETHEIVARLPTMPEPDPAPTAQDYDRWVLLYDTLGDEDRRAIGARIERFVRKPVFSIAVLLTDQRPCLSLMLVASLRRQLYEHWEVCIPDAPCLDPDTLRAIREIAAADARVKLVAPRQHGRSTFVEVPSLALAKGDYLGVLRHDVMLAEQALFEVALSLDADPSLDLIYADEDRIAGNGFRSDPYFKPDTNPGLMLGQDLVGQFGVYRRSLVEQLGGLSDDYDGSQEYDLALRVSEATTMDRIRHIPAVLSHKRSAPRSATSSTDEVVGTAARRALADHLARVGQPGSVTAHPLRSTWHRVRRQRPAVAPLVSIIVPTKDQPDVLGACIDGLLNRTSYPAIEIVIVDHESTDERTVHLLRGFAEDPRVRVVPYAGVFNYSDMNNTAAGGARGSLLAFLNNDVDVIAPQWLDEMVSLAALPDVGAVGAKLLYTDERVQHAGVLLGPGGVAGHMSHLLEADDPGYFGRAVLVSDVAAVTGACLVVRKAVFEEVGGFDSVNLPVAFNDVDLCLKIRQRGYRNVFTPDARLYHHESLSRGSDQAPHRLHRFNAEIAFMMDKWGAVLAADPFYNPNLDIAAGNFGLAFPPRRKKPWRVGGLSQADGG